MKTLIYNKKVNIGKDKYDNSNCYVEVTINDVTDYRKETIEHKNVNNYKTVSIVGNTKTSSGQIVKMLEDNEIIYRVDKYLIRKLIAVWNEYHLNDVQPNCVHQTAFDCNHDFENKAKIETLKCPKHYNYGSKWLVKVIYDKEIQMIQNLFEELAK